MLGNTVFTQSQEIRELQSKLAAAQAHIALLRAILPSAKCNCIVGDHDEFFQCSRCRALAIPTDDAALREQNARLLEEMASSGRWTPDELRLRAAELRSGKL